MGLFKSKNPTWTKEDEEYYQNHVKSDMEQKHREEQGQAPQSEGRLSRFARGVKNYVQQIPERKARQLDNKIAVREREAKLAEADARIYKARHQQQRAPPAKRVARAPPSRAPVRSPPSVATFNNNFDFMGSLGGPIGNSSPGRRVRKRPFDPFRDM